MFAGNFAPRGWKVANGQKLDIGQNSALFSVIGSNFGGDGRTNFALPNLSGRTPVGLGTLETQMGDRTFQIGQTGGREQVKLLPSQLPNFGFQTQDKTLAIVDSIFAVEDETMEGVEVPLLEEVTTTSVGTTANDNDFINTRNPYQAVNFIICVNGEYPLRS